MKSWNIFESLNDKVAQRFIKVKYLCRASTLFIEIHKRKLLLSYKSHSKKNIFSKIRILFLFLYEKWNFFKMFEWKSSSEVTESCIFLIFNSTFQSNPSSKGTIFIQKSFRNDKNDQKSIKNYN
jgi:hypothetical protein